MEHYIGVDLHTASFQVCVLTSAGERVWEDRFAHTADGIAAFLTRCPAASAVAVEASGATWTFADRIVGRVGRLTIVDAAKTRLRAGYVAKTDRLDARRLADALRRESVVSLYYPPVRVRDVRELCRYRAGLVRTRVVLKQRIQALLVRQGVRRPGGGLWGGRGQQWLDTVPVTGRAGESLAGLREVLAHVSAHIAQVDGDVRREAAADPVVGRLQTVPGLGPVLALMIRAEIGSLERFPDAAHLASYAGLVPWVSASGPRVRYGGISRQGSPWLRWALIEAALHGLHRADPVGRWARRLAMRKGVLKTRAAIARRLCEEIYTVWAQASQRLPAAPVGDFMTPGGRTLNDPRGGPM